MVMNIKQLLYAGLLMGLSFAVCAQEDGGPRNALSYRIDVFGSAATGDETPFWLVSNRHGIVPLDANNGYLNPGAFYRASFGKGFRFDAGLDLVATTSRYRNVYIQQLYAELGYRSLLLTIGSKERTNSLWDEALSSGDMVQSPNARPIPEINLSMPRFTVIPLTGGWLQVKGDFAVGRSFDNAYLEQYASEGQYYTKSVLWHHKSIFFRIKDTRNSFPLSLELGVRHWAQWGGTSTDPEMVNPKQPDSLKDFAKIVFAESGGENATASDKVNVLGNHYGSYDFRLAFTKEDWAVAAYYQHYYEDKSGMTMDNGTDGLWGLQVDLPKLPWLKRVVVEHLNTKDQSGPFHYIWYDHDKYPGHGGGRDDYYNNGEYKTGTSYFNRGIGSPLLLSPEYNKDGILEFWHNRVRAWHAGLEGSLSGQVDYRVLFTRTSSWGTAMAPTLNIKESTSALVEITYRHPRLEGWTFTGSLAGDAGSYVDEGIGFGLRVSKQGLLDF